MTDNNQAMVDKVRKLFDKAAAVAGTPEADVFNAKAFELLAKYDIEESVARRTGVSKNIEGSKLIKVTFQFKDRYARERIELIANLATALHCAGILIEQQTGVVIFGVKRHIDRVRLLNSYLEPQMLAGAAKLRTANPLDRRAIADDRKAYMANYAEALFWKVNEIERSAMRQADMNAGDTRMAVARQTDRQRAQDALANAYPGRHGRASKAGGRGSASAAAAGRAAGRAADVGQTRVGAGGQRKLG